MTPDATRRIVEAYFKAWTHNQVEEAFQLLADNLEFAGPTALYKSAAEFKPALVNFASLAKNAHIVEFLVDGNKASMLYDVELPEPVGKLRIASFMWVEGGKIRKYDTRFDATELRKLLARKSG